MNGEKINAIRELRTMSGLGLGLATAKRAVEDWIDREAA
jgi:ribosomal protein L7/L12